MTFFFCNNAENDTPQYVVLYGVSAFLTNKRATCYSHRSQ